MDDTMIVGEGIGMELDEFIRPAAPAREGTGRTQARIAAKAGGKW